jgi:hypothetical protein
MEKRLYEYSSNVFSQFGEDGITKNILEFLNIDSGVVLEIGAWDGFYLSNTANLWSKNENFKAILLEAADTMNPEELNNKYPNVDSFKVFASSENSLEKLIDNCKFDVTNENFVLASIDIDGDDFNVTKSLGKYRPIILIVEPNGNVVERENWVNPNGATVKELVDLGLEMGYDFIGMSGTPNALSGNVYLIRKDFSDLFPITKLSWDERGILRYGGAIYK